MSRFIRVIEQKPKIGFSELLENRAQEIVARKAEPDTSPLSALEREIRLTLDQIERHRKLHANLRRSILRQECQLGTEIIQREPRPPVYVDDRLPERDRLRDRLRKLDRERRSLAVEEESGLQAFHDRLLTLVNRHEQTRM